VFSTSVFKYRQSFPTAVLTSQTQKSDSCAEMRVSSCFCLQVGIGAGQSHVIEAGTALPAVDCSTSSLNDLSSDDLRILVAETRVFGRATPADKLRLLVSLKSGGM
jgi:hypothetical protein